ncbi:hypothetical protein Tco_0411563 [Tanacetum coccineum]
MEAYKKVHNETMRSGLRMAIVQQSMEIDMWEIKEKFVKRREQIAIRAYEEDKRREELNQKIEEVIYLIQSFIQNPISPVKTPQTVTTKVFSKLVQNTSRFEENSGKSYTHSDEVKKDLKDIGFKGVHVTGSDVVDGYGGENLPQTDTILKNLNSKDTGTCIGASESANNQDKRSMTWAGDQSCVPDKDVPSHGPI